MKEHGLVNTKLLLASWSDKTSQKLNNDKKQQGTKPGPKEVTIDLLPEPVLNVNLKFDEHTDSIKCGQSDNIISLCHEIARKNSIYTLLYSNLRSLRGY